MEYVVVNILCVLADATYVYTQLWRVDEDDVRAWFATQIADSQRPGVPDSRRVIAAYYAPHGKKALQFDITQVGG